MALQWAPKESLGGCSITLRLELDINNLAILVYGFPEIMLLAIYLDEHLVDIEGATITSVLPFQSSRVQATELMHQRRIASRLTVMPRSARRSSISR